MTELLTPENAPNTGVALFASWTASALRGAVHLTSTITAEFFIGAVTLKLF